MENHIRVRYKEGFSNKFSLLFVLCKPLNVVYLPYKQFYGEIHVKIIYMHIHFCFPYSVYHSALHWRPFAPGVGRFQRRISLLRAIWKPTHLTTLYCNGSNLMLVWNLHYTRHKLIKIYVLPIPKIFKHLANKQSYRNKEVQKSDKHSLNFSLRIMFISHWFCLLNALPETTRNFNKLYKLILI